MKILVVGISGTGKSALSDLIKNTIIRLDEDENAKIFQTDIGKKFPVSGSESRSREYIIETKQCKLEDLSSKEKEDYDIVIGINGSQFQKWFKEVYI